MIFESLLSLMSNLTRHLDSPRGFFLFFVLILGSQGDRETDKSEENDGGGCKTILAVKGHILPIITVSLPHKKYGATVFVLCCVFSITPCVHFLQILALIDMIYNCTLKFFVLQSSNQRKISLLAMRGRHFCSCTRDGL